MKRHARFFLPVLVLSLLGLFLFAAGALKATEDGTIPEAIDAVQEEVDNAAAEPPRTPDAFDAIEQAVAAGEMTLKDSVMLKARLLFDPQSVSTFAQSSTLRGNTTVNEPCLTGFYKDVHRAFGELTAEERAYLRSLSEDLNIIIRVQEREASGAPAKIQVTALPNFGLTKKVEGVHCTVNYTDTGVNKADAVYAQLVKVYIDMAYAAETRKFRAAYAEPGGTGDKLQIYILNLGAGTWGEWVDVSTVSGKKKSGYIKISNNIKAEGGASWQVALKGTCYHEYFHGVQSAYNWASSLWWMEGTCRWAETFYAGNWQTLKNTFAAADSVFKAPWLPIYQNTFRKYSTVALAYYYADKYGKDGFILSYFEATEGKDDAVEIFKDLMAANATTMGDSIKNFWLAMYTKNIKSIKPYMIDVTKQFAQTYGLRNTVNVYQLGARFHQLKPMAGIPNASLVYKYLPGATGKVEAFTFTDKSKTRVDVEPATAADANYHFTPNFGSVTREVIMVYTDVEYAGQDAAQRSADFEYILPWIKVTKTQITPSTIYAGNYSTLAFTYDLLGTVPGETFPTYVKVTEKAPGVNDNVSGEYPYTVGKGKKISYYFITGTGATPGVYRFTFDFSVPPESWKTKWKIPQVKTSSSFSVRVLKPKSAGSNKAPSDGKVSVSPSL